MYWKRCTIVAMSAVLSSALTLAGKPTAAPAGADAKHRAYTETIAGSKVRFDMVAVPGGTFVMGSPVSEPGRAVDEGPAHTVQLVPFWMGKTEVTWDEYDLFFKKGVTDWRVNEAALAKDADAITRPTQAYADETRGLGRAGHPVIGISHHAAMEYCHWLSKTTGKAYRLPTEAEWEYACRAGTTGAYSFGDDPAQLGEHAWFDKNSEEATRPVGKKKPNPWGLFDMHGNASEWCLDHYQDDWYRTFPAGKLALGPVKLPTAARYSHATRGGSAEDAARLCRSAARRGSDPSWNKIDPDRPQSIWWVWSHDYVGFRVVRAVEEQENLKGIRSKVTRESR